MMLHVTASALTAEIRHLVNPDGVNSTPTSLDQEDRGPMAPLAARKLTTQLQLLWQALAMELVCLFRAGELSGTDLAPLLESTRLAIRSRFPALVEDRVTSSEVEAVAHWLRVDWSSPGTREAALAST